MYDLARAISERGAVVMVPQWGALRPESNDPVEVARGWDEAAAALRFARSHDDEYRGDADRVVVVGHSWGASVAAAIALSGDSFRGTGTDLDSSALPMGCVALDGPMDIRVLVPDARYQDRPRTWDRINPSQILAAGPPGAKTPFRLLIGGTWPEGDASNREFARALKNKGGDVRVTVLRRSHIEMAAPSDQTLDAVFELAGR